MSPRLCRERRRQGRGPGLGPTVGDHSLAPPSTRGLRRVQDERVRSAKFFYLTYYSNV